MATSESRERWRCAVLGSPIAHSLSPVLHLAAYRELDLPWDYSAYDVTQEQLPDFVAGLTDEWLGLSLTMPLKRAVIPLCDRVESRGRLLGSINTVVFDQLGRAGYNTDVPGFVRALAAHGVRELDEVVVLGAGATAASALAAVAESGGDRVTVYARSATRARELERLAEPLGLRLEVKELAELRSAGLTDVVVNAGTADVVVSTIPAEAQAPYAPALTGLGGVLFDVIYDPPVTPFVGAARAAGLAVIPAFDLLLHQAARQVELLTGVRHAPLEAMRAAGLAKLASR
ncbi:MAG: shikimate dehydrogenase [Nocardioidaceae bacterium]